MAFNINQYLDEINKNIVAINNSYNAFIDKEKLNDLNNDYNNLKNAIQKPNNTHAAYNLIAVITNKLDSIHGILIRFDSTNLKSTVDTATTELTTALAELTRLDTEKKEATQKSANLKVELAELKITAGEQNNQLGNLKNSLKEITSELDTTTDTVGSMSNELTNKKQEEEALKTEIAKLDKELNASKDAIEKKNNELVEVNEKIALANTEITNKNAELAGLASKNADLQTEINNAKSETDRLTKELNSVTESHRKLLNDTNILIGKNRDIDSRIAEINVIELRHQENIEMAKNELHTIESNKKTAQTELEAITQKKTRLQGEIDNLKSELSNLANQRETIENEMTGIKNEIEDLKTQQNSLTAQNKGLQDNNLVLANEINYKRKTKLQEINLQISKLETKYDSKKSEIETLDSNIEIQREIEKNLIESNRILNENINASQQHEIDLLAKKAEIEELNKSITDLTKKTEELTTQQNALNATIAKNTAQIKDDEIKIIHLQTEKEKLESSTAHLIAAETELKQNNIELRNQFFATMFLKDINTQIIHNQAEQITTNTDKLGEQSRSINENDVILKQQEDTMKANDELLNTKQEAINSLSGSIKTLTQEAHDIKKTNDETNKQLIDEKQIVAELTTKKRELDEKEAALTTREGDLSKSAKAFEKEKKQLQQQIQQEKDDIEKKLEESNLKIEELNQKLVSANNSLEQLDAKNVELKKDLETATEEYEINQIKHDKEYFIMLLDEVIKAEKYYINHQNGWISYGLNKIDSDANYKVTGKKEYHDYLCTFNAFCSINTYVNYIDSATKYLNEIIKFSDEDNVRISQYLKYKKYITDNIVCPDTNKTTQNQTETSDSVPPPPFEPSSNSQKPPPPPTPLEEIHKNIQIETAKEVTNQNTSLLLEQCILYLDLYIQQHQVHTLKEDDEIQYLTTYKVSKGGVLVDSNEEIWHDGKFKEYKKGAYNIQYKKTNSNNLSKEIIRVTDRRKLRFEPQFIITKIENILKHNDDACNDTVIKDNYLNLYRSITNYLLTLGSYRDTKLNDVIRYIYREINDRHVKCVHARGGKKTKRNTKQNKKTRRNTK